MGFKSRLASKIEAEDPYYVRIEETTPDGVSMTKKIKKRIPEGLSTNDTKVLKSCKRYAYYMDYFFGMCGLHVGWAAVIGIVPFIGVAINVYFGYRLIERAKQVDGGLSSWQLSRMYSNLGVDAALGFVPIVGDFVAAYFKSSARNCAIVEHHMISISRKKTGKLPDIPINHENHELQTNPTNKEKAHPSFRGDPAAQSAQTAGTYPAAASAPPVAHVKK